MGLSIREALKFGELALKKANIVNYKNEAREILENLLKKTPEELFLIKEKNISETNNVACIKKLKSELVECLFNILQRWAIFTPELFMSQKEC